MEDEIIEDTEETDEDEETDDGEEETDEEEEPKITVEEDEEETSEEKIEEKSKEKSVDSFNREMHKAVCADCGKSCEVPFKPTEGRAVYCRDCYRKHMPQRRRF